MNRKSIVLALIVMMCFFAAFAIFSLASPGTESVRRNVLPEEGNYTPTGGGGDIVNAGASNPGIPK